MRVVVQRAIDGQCLVQNEVVGRIDSGFVLLVGFTHTDTEEIVEKMAQKICKLRVFEDEQQKLNKNIFDVQGSILAISQFTLYADTSHGNRPGFTEAMAYTEANRLFLSFVECLKLLNIPVEKGVFGADMKIKFTNDGPITILLDSKDFK